MKGRGWQFRRRHESSRFELLFGGNQAGNTKGDFNAREIGRILFFEINAAADTGRTARGIVRACTFPQSAGKILIARLAYGNPSLVVSGAGLEPEESRGPHALHGFAAQIIKLDKHGGAVGPHNDVGLQGNGCVQLRRHGAEKMLQGLLFLKSSLPALECSESQVEGFRSNAGK